jgi:TetR/AcrR family transcriptional regulator, repressor for uid operon
MAKLNEKAQAARREHILSAAERCFARQGFHQTSIQDICREAGISAGALYVYFASKEDLIAGFCESEKRQLAERLTNFADAPDFVQALSAMAETYCLQQPREKLQLQVEINAEALRNPAIRSTVHAIDAFVLESFERVLTAARDEGRIAPSVDPAMAARVINIIGDGLYWQRALHDDLNVAEVLPVLMSMIANLLNPAPADEGNAEANPTRTGGQK